MSLSFTKVKLTCIAQACKLINDIGSDSQGNTGLQGEEIPYLTCSKSAPKFDMEPLKKQFRNVILEHD